MAYTTNANIGKVRIQAIRMLRSGKSTREVARHFGYAQSTIVKWWKRRDEAWHQKTLPTRSSRPHTSPRQTTKDIEGMIVGVRQETKRCSEVVQQVLKNRDVQVSLSTVKRVLNRYNCIKKRSPWKKRRLYPLRPDIQKQGDLVEFDTIHYVNSVGVKTYIYTALDVYSRYGFALVSEKANCRQSIVFLRNTIKHFPFQIRCIQTDNGPEFGLHFTDVVTRQKMQHRHNHPRSPNENGHLERFNRTLQEEMRREGLCIIRQQDIATFIQYYNTERLHMGINFQTPEQMLKVIPRC